jgi:hypothetical protein
MDHIIVWDGNVVTRVEHEPGCGDATAFLGCWADVERSTLHTTLTGRPAGMYRVSHDLDVAPVR